MKRLIESELQQVQGGDPTAPQPWRHAESDPQPNPWRHAELRIGKGIVLPGVNLSTANAPDPQPWRM